MATPEALPLQGSQQQVLFQSVESWHAASEDHKFEYTIPVPFSGFQNPPDFFHGATNATYHNVLVGDNGSTYHLEFLDVETEGENNTVGATRTFTRMRVSGLGWPRLGLGCISKDVPVRLGEELIAIDRENHMLAVRTIPADPVAYPAQKN